MKKQHIINATLATIAVVTIAATAWGTAALLRSVDSSQGAMAETTHQKKIPENNLIRTDEFKETIDDEVNKRAETIATEAARLLDSDPVAAEQKYREAKDAYSQAGNVAKASEMDANATTAILLAEQSHK